MLALVVRRLVALSREGHGAPLAIALVLSSLAVLAVLVKGARGGPGASVVDLLLLAAAVLAASSPRLTERRPITLAGPPPLPLVPALGVSTLRADPGLRDAIVAAAPTYASAVHWFGGR